MRLFCVKFACSPCQRVFSQSSLTSSHSTENMHVRSIGKSKIVSRCTCECAPQVWLFVQVVTLSLSCDSCERLQQVWKMDGLMTFHAFGHLSQIISLCILCKVVHLQFPPGTLSDSSHEVLLMLGYWEEANADVSMLTVATELTSWSQAVTQFCCRLHLCICLLATLLACENKH